jgi:hypothetical protein
MNSEVREGMSWTFWIGITVIALGVIATGIYYVTLAPALNVERAAYQGSNQYVQSKVTEVGDRKAAWDRLETQAALYKDDEAVVKGLRAQQADDVRQACGAYNLLQDKSLMPATLVSWLAKNGCR